MSYESPLGFYTAVVGRVGNGWDAVGCSGIVASFERAYCLYACGVQGGENTVQSVADLVRLRKQICGTAVDGGICDSSGSVVGGSVGGNSDGIERLSTVRDEGCFVSCVGRPGLHVGVGTKNVGEASGLVSVKGDALHGVDVLGCSNSVDLSVAGAAVQDDGELCVQRNVDADVNAAPFKSCRASEDGGIYEGDGSVDVLDSVSCRKVAVSGAFGSGCHKERPCGPNVLRNRQWRKEKKEKKQSKKAKQSSMKLNWRKVSENDVDDDLRKTSTAKWKAQNELAAEKARRELEVLRANDVSGEVKRYRTKVNAMTERNMVSIEKTHATLRATGNVAGEFHGSAETVLTPGLSSGTISPDSSASMHEFRAVQKKALDQEKEIEVLKKKLALVTEKTGVSGQYIDLYEKDIWTNNSVNDAILDEMYPCGYGADGTYCEKGKSRIIPTY